MQNGRRYIFSLISETTDLNTSLLPNLWLGKQRQPPLGFYSMGGGFTYRTLDFISDMKRKHVSVFHFYFIETNGNKNKKASKTRNEFN
jgi:hypothetical protein